MDFRLTPEQLELKDALQGYCAREYSPERLAARDGQGIDRQGWLGLAGLGVLALRVPESEGGLGLGWVATAAAYEVLGFHLVPGPLVWSQLLADVVPGVADGALIVTGVDHPAPAAPFVVDHLPPADALAVLDDDGVSLAVLDPGDAEPLDPLDPLTPVARLPHIPAGGRVVALPSTGRVRAAGAALTGALLTGIADRALHEAREYALAREQFDRPIASFQAVQHILADMYVRVMLARSAAYASAAILDDPGSGELASAASAAKIVAGDAAMANSRAAIQVHGGMGFTWEMLPHYLLKRTWVLEHSFGTPAEHAESLASTLGAGP